MKSYKDIITIMVDGEEVTASMAMLNRISLWIREASRSPENKNIADIYKDISIEIYNQLNELGYYNNDIKNT